MAVKDKGGEEKGRGFGEGGGVDSGVMDGRECRGSP